MSQWLDLCSGPNKAARLQGYTLHNSLSCYVGPALPLNKAMFTKQSI